MPGHGIRLLHIRERKDEYRDKWRLCLESNIQNRRGGIAEAMLGANVVIAFSKPGPNTIKTEWVRGMEQDPIVFACANPIPEIWPWEAQEAGARIIGTGRGDFPNQLNNSLGFPGIFRGALDVRARTISEKMCLSAAHELARCAREKGLSEENIVPSMEDWEIFPQVATAVGMTAMEQGVAALSLSRDELSAKAEATIRRAREETACLMRDGYIPVPPSV